MCNIQQQIPDFVQALTLAGAEVYLVGGYVRNLLLEKFCANKQSTKDIDLLVRNISAIDVEQILSKYDKVKHVGESFGVFKFRDMDIALPRIEKSTGFGHKQFEIVIDCFAELIVDLSRRDATINAMAIRIYNFDDIGKSFHASFHVIDYFGGIDDLVNGIWKATGDPKEKFAEDPLRMLRAVRQCNELGFKLDKNTSDAFDENLLLYLSKERISEEIVRCLKYGDNGLDRFNQVLGLNEINNLNDNSGDNKNDSHDDNRDNNHDNNHDNNQNNSQIFNECNLRQRVARYISAQTEKGYNWAIQYNLSAAPSFPSRDMKFLKALSESYVLLDQKNDIEQKQKHVITLIQKYDNDIVRDMIIYKGLIEKINVSDLLDCYQNNVGIIKHISQVNLNGHKMKECFGITGKDIGKIKQFLFEKITNGLIENDQELLIKYLHSLDDLNNLL